MTEQIVLLARQLGAPERKENLLELVCQAAEQELSGQLKPGLTPEDCGGLFPLAAAWMALDTLEAGGGDGGVTSFTAGEVTIRREPGDTRRRARELLAPYLMEEGFGFMGVRG